MKEQTERGGMPDAWLAEKALFEKAKEYAFAYRNEMRERAVAPSADAVQALRAFDEPLADGPADPGEIIRLLHEVGAPATVNTTGGRYFGFVNGGSLPASLAARWMADVWDQNAALYVMSPVASRLEAVCERWLIDLIGLPAGSVAGFVSGTSTATVCGLAAGRNRLLEKLGWDVSARGLAGAPPIRIVAGQQAHATVFKAISLLGLGKDNVELAPVDDQGRIIAEKMPVPDNRTLLILQAGNVNSGAFDPFDRICGAAREAGAWTHIDGAFGLWCAASPRLRHLTRGAELADSWSVDAHKTLNAPYDGGIILCRDPKALVGAMQASGSYILYSENRDGMLYTPEMSRRARGIELWAALKSLGKKGVAALVEGLHANAALFSALLRENSFRVMNDVHFNQVMFACETPERTLATLSKLQQSGECWCGGAVWNGLQVIRVSVCCWATTDADVRRSVLAMVAARNGS